MTTLCSSEGVRYAVHSFFSWSVCGMAFSPSHTGLLMFLLSNAANCLLEVSFQLEFGGVGGLGSSLMSDILSLLGLRPAATCKIVSLSSQIQFVSLMYTMLVLVTARQIFNWKGLAQPFQHIIPL